MRPYTHVCARCALRFEGGGACPKCDDARHVFDGAEQGAQEKARASLRTFASWRKLRLRIGEIIAGLSAMRGAIALSLVTGAVLTAACGTMRVLAPHGQNLEPCLLTGWVIALAPLALYALRPRAMLKAIDADRAREDAVSRDAARTPRITAHVPAIDLAIPLVMVRGIARGEERLVSPIGRVPCLAWVIAGSVPTGPFSTASSVSFALESEGETSEVDASVASIELTVGAPRPIEPDAAFAALLERQLAYPREGTVSLAEAVLRSGDAVRVLGPFETSARPDGYRGAREIRSFREVKGGPIVLRSPESASPDTT